MNTKHKILEGTELVEALGDSPAILVIGSFDPLQAVHADRLNELARPARAKLVVAVTDPPQTVLSLVARTEMVAALGMVDFVMSYQTGIEIAFPWASTHDDTALHNRWSADFKQHVLRRSKATTA